jgi:hypothetical protein
MGPSNNGGRELDQCFENVKSPWRLGGEGGIAALLFTMWRGDSWMEWQNSDLITDFWQDWSSSNTVEQS